MAEPELAPTFSEYAIAEEPVPSDTAVFTVVEEPPAFPGGKESLKLYIQEHLRYPRMAKKER